LIVVRQDAKIEHPVHQLDRVVPNKVLTSISVHPLRLCICVAIQPSMGGLVTKQTFPHLLMGALHNGKDTCSEWWPSRSSRTGTAEPNHGHTTPNTCHGLNGDKHL